LYKNYLLIMSICGGLFSLASCNMTNNINQTTETLIENVATKTDFQKHISENKEESLNISVISKDLNLENIEYNLLSDDLGYFSLDDLVNKGSLDFSAEEIYESKEIYAGYDFLGNGELFAGKIINDDIFGIVINWSYLDSNITEPQIISITRENRVNQVNISMESPSKEYHEAHESWGNEASLALSMPKEYEKDILIINSICETTDGFSMHKFFVQNNKPTNEPLEREGYISIPFYANTKLTKHTLNTNEVTMHENGEFRLDFNKINEFSNSIEPIGIEEINIYKDYNEIVFRELKDVKIRGFDKNSQYNIYVVFDKEFFNENRAMITILE